MSAAVEHQRAVAHSKSSSQLYMTPHLAKRRDGLCPSLFLSQSHASKSALGPAASNLIKSYRTNSNLLLQVKERDGVNREILELQSIVESVHRALEEVVSPEDDIVAMNFKPQGCKWKLEFNHSLDEADNHYRIEVLCLANEINGVTNFVVDTILVPKQHSETPLPGFKQAKEVFDLLCLRVRKSIVRLEFPEFPEGCKGRAFREVYQLNARLKSGSFATVCRGTHRATGRKVAIKCVLRKDLPPADDAAIYDEVAILASLNHPHIVPLIDFFDEKDCYFIVMELMSGGDLFDRIGKKKSYSEADARDLIVKMLKAVAYCHARKIAHCDMKPKNLLLMTEENDSFIKLADFGFAARVHEAKSLSKQCGTPFFVSPEILLRKPYDHQSDMWSVGCIVFLLLSGNLPFMGRSQKELFRKIVSGKYEFAEEDWKEISEDAKDLVKRMLVLNPDDRITAAEAVRHNWLKASRDRLSLIALQGTSQRLKSFNARMKLRSAMIACDWVSSLKRMSWMSMRDLNGSSGGSNSATGGSSRHLVAVKKAQDISQRDIMNYSRRMNASNNAEQSQSKSGSSRNLAPEADASSSSRRNINAATKSLKNMTLKDKKEDEKKRHDI